MKNKDKVFYIVIVSVIVLLVVFFDQLTKILIVKNIELHANIKVIPNFFYLEYTINSGAAFGMFQDNDFVILGIPFVAIILFLYLLYKSNFQEKKFFTLAISFMLGGTIGNYIDRIRLGYVVDFLSFRFGSYHYPNFNLADSLLVIGAILLFIDIIFIETFNNKKVDDIDDS